MDQQKICQCCSQQHHCREIYQKLANFKGSSIVLKVIVAFLLPIMVFIASLAAFEGILAKAIETKSAWGCLTAELRTALSFLLALSVTFAAMLIIKVINGKRQPETGKW